MNHIIVQAPLVQMTECSPLTRKNSLFAGSDSGPELWAASSPAPISPSYRHLRCPLPGRLDELKLNDVDPQVWLAALLVAPVSSHSRRGDGVRS